MSNIISSNSGHIADEASEAPRLQSNAKKEKLGVALVGLGTYSEQQLAPALKLTKQCQLTGLVSGQPEKSDKWRVAHNLKQKNVYSYQDFDSIKSNDDIDIVYIVLPNAMHAEYVIRAAEAGKHVICEKPMGVTIEECQRMIRTCEKAGVKLSMGYRLHFDPFNQEMMRLGQQRILGNIERVIAKNGMDVGKKNQWRLNKALAGGGPLMDVGIYCVQGVLYTMDELPTAVTARFVPKQDPEKFSTVEEGMDWEMEFPDGKKAICETSYSKPMNILRAETDKGWFELQPAYEYSGLKGNTSAGPMKITPVNQQAAQMDDFASCIKLNEGTRVPGAMGLRDMHILLALYKSARSGQRVELKPEAFEKLIGI